MATATPEIFVCGNLAIDIDGIKQLAADCQHPQELHTLLLAHDDGSYETVKANVCDICKVAVAISEEVE